MLLLAVTLLLGIVVTGCKPITAPGTTYAAPQGTFTLILPPDFAVAPAMASSSAPVPAMGMSFAAFDNPKTGERIAVGFIPLTGIVEVDAMMLPVGLSALPVGDDWTGVALAAMNSSILTDQRYESTRTVEGDSVRLDMRNRESGAAISMYFEQRGQTLAVLAATNPHEPVGETPGVPLLDMLLPVFVWPAPAAPVTPTAIP